MFPLDPTRLPVDCARLQGRQGRAGVFERHGVRVARELAGLEAMHRLPITPNQITIASIVSLVLPTTPTEGMTSC